MSLGRGKMLQSVKEKVLNDIEGRTSQYHMPDYTNETIEKFCRRLAEKGAEEYINNAVDHSSGSSRDSGQRKTDTSQFDDVEKAHWGTYNGTESTNSDSEGTEFSSCSLQSGVNEEEKSPVKSSMYTSSRSPVKLHKDFQRKNPSARLAVKWPAKPTSPKPKIEAEFPAAAIGRGSRLKMVSAMSASVTKENYQREIMMACDPSYTNDRIESYLDKRIRKNEMDEIF